MGKFSRTWELMSASWQALKQDRALMIFPLFSMICCLIVIASFAIPMYSNGTWEPPGEGATTEDQIMYYVTLFLFYFCNYFVIVFFNSAIIACATIRMKGGRLTIGEGFRASFSLLPFIIGWAVVAATVGLILRIIEDRSKKIGRFVAGFLGIAWSVTSFLVVPVMVVEEKGPFAALSESARLLKKTWGEQIISHFSYELIFFVLGIPAFVLIAFGVLSGSMAATIIFIIIGIVYLVTLALIESALQSIFQAALYLYAREGKVAEGFSLELLRKSIR